MRHLLHSIIIVIALSSICLASIKDLKKAEKLTQRRMYPQAIKILERDTHLKSATAGVYFLLGKCYLRTDKYDRAEKNFDIALIQKPAYKTDIAMEYKNEGVVRLRKKDIESAIRMFNTSVDYQPAVAGLIAEDYKQFGSSYLKKDDPDTAKLLFDRALKINPALNLFIAESLFNFGTGLLNTHPDKAETIFNWTISYHPAFASKVCDAYFERMRMARQFPADLVDKALKCGNHSDEEIVKALDAKFHGEILVINLKGDGEYNVGMVENGQEIDYLYTSHSFEHRICKAYRRGWGSPGWYDPTGLSSYIVNYSGRLQIKTDDRPLKLILAIKSTVS